MEVAHKFELAKYMMEQVAKASMLTQLSKAKENTDAKEKLKCEPKQKLPRGHPIVHKTEEERKEAQRRAAEKYVKKKQQERSIEKLKIEFLTLGSESQVKLISELIALITF